MSRLAFTKFFRLSVFNCPTTLNHTQVHPKQTQEKQILLISNFFYVVICILCKVTGSYFTSHFPPLCLSDKSMSIPNN